MGEDNAYQATPAATLEQQIMDPCIPKNDREQWAAREIARLRAEVEQLRADAQAIAALLPGPYYMDPPDGGDVPVIEQIRRMAVDAQRYRHMKSHALYQPASWGYYPASYLIRLWDNESKPLERATLDAYIDAARAAQGERG